MARVEGSRPGVGIGLVVLGAGAFIVNAGVSRVALRHGVDAAMLTTVRITFTFLVLVLVAACFRRASLRRPRGRTLALVLVHGVVGGAALQWTYFVAIDRLPVGMALLLEYQAPILVALWARLVQGQQVRPRLWLGLALAILGLGAATQVWSGARFDGLGILAGLGAALCFATYFLVGEAGLETLDPLQLVIWSFGIASVAINLVAPLTGFDTGLLGEQVSLLGNLSGLSVPLWAVLVWVVLPGTLLPFFVEVLALSFVRATTVTMIAMLEPMGVVALGWAWFDETLGLVAVLGCVAVVAGILVAQSARVAVPAEPPVLT